MYQTPDEADAYAAERAIVAMHGTYPPDGIACNMTPSGGGVVADKRRFGRGASKPKFKRDSSSVFNTEFVAVDGDTGDVLFCKKLELPPLCGIYVTRPVTKRLA